MDNLCDLRGRVALVTGGTGGIGLGMGEAHSSLQTSRETAVTATAGSQSATATITVTAAPTVTLKTTSASPVVNAAPVSEVGVSVASGAPPVKSVTVAFGDGNRVNLGKRRSINHAVRKSDSEIIVSVDSDVVIDPNAIRELTRRFVDDRIAAVGGWVDVRNKHENWRSRGR